MLSKLFKRFRGDQKGGVLILVGFISTALVVSTGIAIDFGNLYMLQKNLQVTADAAALGAAAVLPDEAEAQIQAVSLATKNMAVSQHGSVLLNSDIIMGEWDDLNKTFSPASVTKNAIRITVKRSASNGNPADYFFGKIIGYSEADLVASAIAIMMPADCFAAGGTAGGRVFFGSDAGLSGFCMYGRLGVDFGADAVIDSGAQIGALDVGDIRFGQNPTYPDDALISIDKMPTKADGIDAYIDDLESGAQTVPGMTNVVVGNSLPSVLVEGTVYIVNSSVNVNNSNTAQNVLIAVRGNIQFGTGASLVNTGDIDTGAKSIGVISTGDVKFVHDGEISGVDVIAGKDIVIGQDAGALAATFTAKDNIHIGKRAQLDYNQYDEAVSLADPVQAAVLVN